MKLPLALALLLGAPPSAHRSLGYAGSTPVGLDAYTAFATFDCARINADRQRSPVRIPIAADCSLSIPSPDMRASLRTDPAPDGTATLRATGGLVVRQLDPPTVLRWNPDSSSFFLNGGEGSGQVSNVRYFHRTTSGWRETTRLRTAADLLYRRRFDCRGGPKSYLNTSGWDWPSPHRLRVIVQEGVHSEGCLQPHEDRNVLFEVVGDPLTGRIVSAREIETLP